MPRDLAAHGGKDSPVFSDRDSDARSPPVVGASFWFCTFSIVCMNVAPDGIMWNLAFGAINVYHLIPVIYER